MIKARICAVIVNSDLEALAGVSPLIDLYEVRIDLIGAGWEGVVKRLNKPWIATNRLPAEGGRARGTEEERLQTLLGATKLGASVIDIELRTPQLQTLVSEIKKRAECLISYHDLSGTPPLNVLKGIVEKEIAAGADIAKVVTTASTFESNLTVLRLIKEFPKTRMVALTMGDLGIVSRILSPTVGGYFTYASLSRGKESAPGQMTVSELREIFGMLP